MSENNSEEKKKIQITKIKTKKITLSIAAIHFTTPERMSLIKMKGKSEKVVSYKKTKRHPNDESFYVFSLASICFLFVLSLLEVLLFHRAIKAPILIWFCRCTHCFTFTYSILERRVDCYLTKLFLKLIVWFFCFLPDLSREPKYCLLIKTFLFCCRGS